MSINAKYLILHGKNELETGKIFKLKPTGVKIFSKKDLIKKGYPAPNGELYLIYKIEKDASEDFDKAKFDLRKLSQFETYRNSAKPFSVMLVELLKAKLPEK